MQHPTEGYFVRLDVVPTATRPALVDRTRHAYSEGEHHDPPRKRRRRRRIRPSVLILLLLAAWCGWAMQRPGGISGTINGWIEHVRGDVVSISADPDMHKATVYYNQQYANGNAYPNLTDDQVAAASGIGVTAEWCSSQAVVLQGSVGGGTSSRLLLSGKEVGTLAGRHDCPADLSDPQPWKK